MTKEIKYHIETIKCPECSLVQEAKVEYTFPWNTFVHDCIQCNYVIMESEWHKVLPVRHSSFYDFKKGKLTEKSKFYTQPCQ